VALGFWHPLPPCVVCQVDATAESELKDRFDIQGFPTLRWSRNGVDFKEYDGGRTRVRLCTALAARG
jgi:hypothetical protein